MYRIIQRMYMYVQSSKQIVFNRYINCAILLHQIIIRVFHHGVDASVLCALS